MQMQKRTYRLGELYCGPGGLALGAHRAKVLANGVEYGVEFGWANDYEADTCETYRNNIAPAHADKVVCKDVHQLDLASLGPIDAFAFGFPCNDFSIVGEQKGLNGKFGPLYTYGVKVLDAYRPLFFVAENVGGIRAANNGQAFWKIVDELKKAGPGYRITAHLYKFEQYGVPQTRHRVVIVGVDKNTELIYRVPAPTTPEKYVTVREALTVPPIPVTAANHELTAQSKIVIERLGYIKAGKNIWETELPPHLQLNLKGEAKLSHIYKRLDPDKPSYTVTGSGGGGTHVYHWSEPRALTNRERARIQTFPDDFVFTGKKESVRKQIGMAVPPKGAEVVFTAILNTLAGVEYKSVPANLIEDGKRTDGKND